jgi:hypothetical protein
LGVSGNLVVLALFQTARGIETTSSLRKMKIRCLKNCESFIVPLATAQYALWGPLTGRDSLEKYKALLRGGRSKQRFNCLPSCRGKWSIIGIGESGRKRPSTSQRLDPVVGTAFCFPRIARQWPIFIVEKEGAPVAFFNLKRKDHNTAELPMIYIDLDCLGGGIGLACIEYMEQWLKEHW